MGRSVDYPSDNVTVCYQSIDMDMNWQEIIAEIQDRVIQAWPSFYKSDVWTGRELLMVAQNTFANVIVSEYCGLMSVSLQSRAEEYLNTGYTQDAQIANLADAWCNRIKGRFERMFGELRKIATASNGEGLYERIDDNE